MGVGARNPLVELTLDRLREFLREPSAIFWTFGFPVVLAVLLGIAFRTRPPEPAHVAILGRGEAADRVAAILGAAEGVELERDTAAAVSGALRTGRIDLVVEPSLEGGRLELDYRYDASRPESRAARLAVDDAIERGLGRRDAAGARDRRVTEPGGRYIDFLIPGLIGLNIMSSSMWGIGYNVVWERRRRLLRRLVVTPMRRAHYLLSHMLSRLVFLVLEVGFLLFAGWLIFGVVVYGSLFWVGVLAVLGAFAFMGVALLIAARPDNTEVASGWMNAVMLPMYLLSGSFFTYERFPAVVHPIIRLLPLTAFNDALRAVVNEGASAWSTWPEVLVLLAWGTLGFFIALRFFKWQ
jgi:ABC-2 type transport system permease protein